MRFPSSFIFIIVFIMTGVLGAGLYGQSSQISVPLLGFIPDKDAVSIRPILGLPGASLIGPRLLADSGVTALAISPKQDYAIGVEREDRQIVAIRLGVDSAQILPIAGTRSGDSIVGTSPSGSFVGIYYLESRTLQVIRLRPEVSVVAEFDATAVPGNVAELTVSDDGRFSLLRASEAAEVSLWILDANFPRRLPLLEPRAATFFLQSPDAVVLEDGGRTVSIIREVAHAAIRLPLISFPEESGGFSNIAAAENGERIFLSDSESGTVAVVETQTGMASILSCDCRPSGFYRLKGASVFRLNDNNGGPLFVLDASSEEPRIVIVPPDASHGGER